MTASAASARCSKACSDRFGWDAGHRGRQHHRAWPSRLAKAAISLEPGGQFELSGAPLETVHETCEELREHLAQVREVGGELGIGFLGLGFSPKWTLRRNAGDAEGALRDHDALHAEGRARTAST